MVIELVVRVWGDPTQMVVGLGAGWVWAGSWLSWGRDDRNGFRFMARGGQEGEGAH